MPSCLTDPDHRAYSDNHTTSTKQLTVDKMASSERVTINPEGLRDGDGTLRRALERWSCRTGPVKYNQWQSVFSTLVREYEMKDEEAPAEEARAERQKRIRDMYHGIQGRIHRLDHLAIELLRGEGGRAVVRFAEQQPQTAAGQDLSRDADLGLPSRSAQEVHDYSLLPPLEEKQLFPLRSLEIDSLARRMPKPLGKRTARRIPSYQQNRTSALKVLQLNLALHSTG